MEIIKQGNLAVKRYKMVCNRCGCEAIYEENELHYDQRDGDYVICPCCGLYVCHYKQNLIV